MKYLKEFIMMIKYGYKSSSERYCKYLKKKGINLGKNVSFYSPWTINIDIQRPWMIDIGSNVHITAYVKILQHGYDWAVLQRKYGKILGSSGKVKIGNNVFIGQNTTILKGTIIEDNVIIGAHSLVNKKCEANSVYAGVPAKKICTLEEYLKKREEAQLNEAIELVLEYYKKYNKYPNRDFLREYFWLFESEYGHLCNTFKDVFKLNNNEMQSISEFKKNKPKFKNYEDFIQFVGSGKYDK